MGTHLLLLGLVALLVGGAADSSSARTWTVEKDDSGDFTVIQDAIDAAASGDSVLIGPGRYDTFRAGASTVDGFQFAAIAWVTKPNLTIIGAGRDVTTIGPVTYTHEAAGLPACGLYFDGGAVGGLVSGVALENLRSPMTIRDQVTVEQIRGTRSNPSATFTLFVLDGLDTVIRNCEFFGGDAVITGSGSGRVSVEDCTFDDATGEGTAIEIGNGAQDCSIRRCNVLRTGVGFVFSFGGTGVVEDSRIENITHSGINVPQGTATIRNCDIGESRISLRVGGGRVEVYDTIIRGGSQHTIASTGDVYVRNSHILNGGAQSVLGSTSIPGWLIDLRENWWGTDDAAQIEAWITDEDGTVLWEPILDAPVSADASSVTQLKGSFGHR